MEFWLLKGGCSWLCQKCVVWICLTLRFPSSLGIDSFCGRVCCSGRRGDTCCLVCSLFVVTARFCWVLFFCCCALWFFFAMDTICSWLYSSLSPCGVLGDDVLRPCVSDIVSALLVSFPPECAWKQAADYSQSHRFRSRVVANLGFLLGCFSILDF